LSSRRERRRRDTAPMPSMSAGLLRFFEEETEGIKIRPQIVVIMALVLSAFALLAHLGVFPF